MSYDVSIDVPACDHCGRADDNVCDWNYTSNCGPMWRHAGADLADFDGQPTTACATILAAALDRMRADPETYRAMNPPNGWGSYDRLVPRLEALLSAFRARPTGIVRVSR